MKKHLIYHTQVALKGANPESNNVCIETKDHHSIDTYLQSISRDGITVTCDQHNLTNILPNRFSVSPKQPVELPISFTLTEKIEAHCDVIYVRRLSKDIFQVEMRFKQLSPQDEELVDQYVEHSLKTKYSNEPLSKVA